jgi:light-regulated signal transduction histidine kinase (bacteriophytochrome)
MDQLRLRIAEFLNSEDQLLAQRSARLQSEWQQTDAVLWGGLFVGLLGGFLAVWLLGRGVSDRLALLAGRAEVFSQGTLPPVRPYEADEIGKLGKALFAAYKLALEHAEKLRENERQLRAQRDALEAANAELEAFSYSVSHDLRAPLRHVDGFSRILLEDYAPQLAPEAKRLLGRICDGTRRMGTLIDELLNLGRIGRKPLEVQIAGLGALVEQARSELGSEISEREIEWRIGALPFAECDSGLLRQVFTNLLSNAVKYTRPRALAVIEVGETMAQGKRAIFVRDNGVGFSMKYADKLFGVFQRLHRQEDFEGTGVGLAAAARIIQRHGGRIWAEAELDRGACFYFTLPSLEEQTERIAISVASRNGVADEARS